MAAITLRGMAAAPNADGAGNGGRSEGTIEGQSTRAEQAVIRRRMNAEARHDPEAGKELQVGARATPAERSLGPPSRRSLISRSLSLAVVDRDRGIEEETRGCGRGLTPPRRPSGSLLRCSAARVTRPRDADI